MAKKLRTPGQKRKSLIRKILLVLVVLSFVAFYNIEGPGQKAARQLAAQHEEVQAHIVHLNENTEEYRNFKGRRRTRTVYSLEYEFDYNGEAYSDVLDIGSSEYESLQASDKVTLWFANGYADSAELKSTIMHDANESGSERMIETAPAILVVAYVLNVILCWLFGREPNGHLPEGFYTENSWLDIEDKYLIAIDDSTLYSVEVDKNSIDKVQELYQNDASVEAMIDVSRGKVVRIPFASVTGISSDHFRDTIDVTYSIEAKSKTESIEFLNATVKLHALERISEKLPQSLNKEETQLTRIQAALPSLIFSVILLGVMVFFVDSSLVVLGCTIALFFSIKTLLKRLINPTHTTRWQPLEELQEVAQ